jgi:pimeloyl-ACP methyl ester carboxylesterase
MAVVERGDLRLRYERSADGARELVFVHGWCCDRTFWAPQLAHFAPSCRTTTFDLRGCGESSRPEHGYDIPSLADDVAWLCDQLGIERPVVLGHSLGAMIAIELASRRPSSVAAVVGVDPGPIHYLPETRQRFEALAAALAGAGGEDVRRTWVEETAGPTVDDEVRAQIVETMCSVPLAVAAAFIEGVTRWNGAGALALCDTVPMLIIRSEASSTDEPWRLRRLKPDVQFGVTVGAGHFNHLEVPEQVNAMVERFLAYFVP